LSYITPFVVAMGFPAGELIEKIYRNDVNDVSSYLDVKHRDCYKVYNMCGRKVLEEKFHNRVFKTEQWKDHHSPQLITLFEVCDDIF
jgi:hypothetical protein